MESDGGAFLVGPCNGQGPENGNEDYDEYNVENDDGVYEECFEDEEDNNNEGNDQPHTEAVSVDGSSLQSPCNGFQHFDIINLIIQEIAKRFLLLQMNPLNLRAPEMLSVGSRLTKLEAHIAIMSTFDKFVLKIKLVKESCIYSSFCTQKTLYRRILNTCYLIMKGNIIRLIVAHAAKQFTSASTKMLNTALQNTVKHHGTPKTLEIELRSCKSTTAH